mmetsp:Transcript_10601/g.32712  ORF Transcript_10601/g.32712 Transcript_10601/m.32712 type:complete len:242 (-) Transcript_10601:32-757(-)
MLTTPSTLAYGSWMRSSCGTKCGSWPNRGRHSGLSRFRSIGSCTIGRSSQDPSERAWTVAASSASVFAAAEMRETKRNCVSVVMSRVLWFVEQMDSPVLPLLRASTRCRSTRRTSCSARSRVARRPRPLPGIGATSTAPTQSPCSFARSSTNFPSARASDANCSQRCCRPGSAAAARSNSPSSISACAARYRAFSEPCSRRLAHASATASCWALEASWHCALLFSSTATSEAASQRASACV